MKFSISSCKISSNHSHEKSLPSQTNSGSFLGRSIIKLPIQGITKLCLGLINGVYSAIGMGVEKAFHLKDWIFAKFGEDDYLMDPFVVELKEVQDHKYPPVQPLEIPADVADDLPIHQVDDLPRPQSEVFDTTPARVPVRRTRANSLTGESNHQCAPEVIQTLEKRRQRIEYSPASPSSPFQFSFAPQDATTSLSPFKPSPKRHEKHINILKDISDYKKRSDSQQRKIARDARIEAARKKQLEKEDSHSNKRIQSSVYVFNLIDPKNETAVDEPVKGLTPPGSPANWQV